MNPGEPLRRPRAIPPHPHFAVLAIGSTSDRDRIEAAATALERKGVRLTLASNLFDAGPRTYLAGSDALRAEEINRFLRSDEYDAFLFSRGGYGAMRILDQIDFDAIIAQPRPVIGYSDLTALHQAIATRAGIATFHGPMLNFDLHEGLSDTVERWFWDMLSGHAPLSHSFGREQVLSSGSAEGIFFGGCLSLTVALIGTPFDYWVDDGIWFWEDVSEPTYRIDRMLTHLRLSGRLNRLRAVLIGKLKACGGKDARELDELLAECFGGSGIPVVRDMPFGHHGNNLMLPVGRRGRIDTEQLRLSFPEPVVEPPAE